MTLVEFIVFAPLLAVLAILFGSPARATAIVAAVANLAAAGLMTLRFPVEVESKGQVIFASSRNLLASPNLNLAFGLDGISLVLVILTVLVTLAAVWASPAEGRIKGNVKLYYSSSLLIASGALGAFCATDLFFFYAFHELALIPTFLMIGIFGSGENRKRTAWTITIFLGVGSLILLAGLIALLVETGGKSFAFADLYAVGDKIPADAQKNIYLILLIGFGILVSLFPFHSWAPPAYAQAPTPVAMLHAGVLKKFGLYGLIRVAMPLLPEGAAHWQTLLLVLLLGNILILGLVTIAQRRLDTLLGYSSVMHMGYVFLGIASGNTIGLHGAVLLMFAHGISIALLFALAGAVRERMGTLDMDELGGGLAKKAPALGLLFGFAAFASIGLPGFANFAAEVMVFFGSFQPILETKKLGALQWAGILSLWGVVISAVYMLRAYRKIFKGPLTDKDAKAGIADLTLTERAPALLLIVALMAVGFVPGLLLKYLTPTLEAIAMSLKG
ncbi:MAG: NADH-quinone oxidoreductase subunit M [Verrucomicrobiales bacterium]|nr:NADH-quinone oxidoreductase subunit M [Verrucomicrobiales bacterium]